MKLQDDDVLMVLRALYWYQDKLENTAREMSDNNWIELENIDFLRQTMSEYIKNRGYLK
jgi:hypothetical protein